MVVMAIVYNATNVTPERKITDAHITDHRYHNCMRVAEHSMVTFATKII